MTQEVEHARVTDEMLERARSRIGVERAYVNPWNDEVTRAASRHWAWGIGDPNPLWWDQAYGKSSSYGSIIAAPTFLYSTNVGPLWHPGTTSRGAGLPGLHGLETGHSWEWYRPVQIGDIITATSCLKDIVEKPRSSYTERMFQRFTEIKYTDDQGDLVATQVGHGMSFERGRPSDRPSEKRKYADIPPWCWTDEELRKIAEDYDNEVTWGARPHYWEDVAVGESIGYVVKGPLTTISLVTFFQGWGGHYCMTDKIWHLYRKAHPKAAIADPTTNIPDAPSRSHFDPWVAKQLGFGPGGYDIICQRVSWYGHLLTNWIGDDGFLRRLSVELRRPNWLGDATWVRGTVTRRYEEGGEHYVDCELWADNQRGDRHSTGTATVILPTRTRPGYGPGTARMKRR